MGDIKRFWLGFNLVPGIGPSRLRALLDAFGDVETAWHAPTEALKAAGLGDKIIAAFEDVRKRVNLDAEWDRIVARGIQVTTWDDEDYPHRLREIPAPPALLYVFGSLELHDRWAVAIVGTRRATPYGDAVTREIATALVNHGVTVVSGLARGIDGIAHKAALDAGGRTIAVLGSGMDHVYPPEHRKLAQAIAAQGAVISDYPMGTRPEPRNFPPRNRIISGMSMLVVVTEAGAGSGALITADFAAEQGRDVFAVPGDILRHTSRGANQLICSGAQPMLSPEDVLEALNLDIVARQEIVEQELPENEIERKILHSLGSEPVHVDELQSTCGLPISQISALLALLELKGRVRQVGGMQYIRVREARTAYRVD